MKESETSEIVRAGSITYFFDVKEARSNEPFLIITASRFKGEDQERERSSIIIFREHAYAFLEAAQLMADRIGSRANEVSAPDLSDLNPRVG